MDTSSDLYQVEGTKAAPRVVVRHAAVEKHPEFSQIINQLREETVKWIWPDLGNGTWYADPDPNRAALVAGILEGLAAECRGIIYNHLEDERRKEEK